MNSNNGYYKVGNQIFFDKIKAILFANQTLDNIEWNFNDDVFESINWIDEPETSLQDFYKNRAQQIRDQYDYIILMCSGGADSTNVAYTFLNNNILVDEIIAAAPISGLNNYNTNTKDNRAENVISETVYAQLPLMSELSQKFPSVKITLHDYFEDMLGYETDDWLLRSGDWIHPSCVARYSLEKFKHIKDLAESGKRVAVVYGIDKPTLTKDKHGDISVMISDLAVNVPRPPFSKDYPSVDIVLFYWTPEMPQMLAKQAHAVANYIYKPENKLLQQYMFYPTLPYDIARYNQSRWEKSIIPAIYPDQHRNVFQSHKPLRLFLANIDEWFYKLHSNTITWQMIDSDFRNFIKTIDSKYLLRNRLGFKINCKFYKIGNESKFDIPTDSKIIS